MTLRRPPPLAEPVPAALLLAALLLVALWALAAVRLTPPDPLAADAPPAAFSALRARATIEQLVGDGTPHPVGSAANEGVFYALEYELQELGLKVEVQETFHCSRKYMTSAWLRNVLVRIDGRERGPGKAVLLMAHYDSREAAPGVGDDLAGVAAIIEVVRALQARELGAPRRPIILLFTDAEEAGLIGADAFVDAHPWFEEVGVVINLEGRGNAGPSLMFETGVGDGEVVRRWGAASPRPFGSSGHVAVYRRMPNDTDFTPFRNAGLPGLNFAYIGRVAHYHTSADSLENLDLGSLQHHGDHVTDLVQDLAWGPPLQPAQDAVFFDVFSLFLVRWPASLSPFLAGLGLLLLLLAARPLRASAPGLRAGAGVRLAAGEVGWGGLAVLLALPASLGLVYVAASALSALGATPFPFVAHPGLHVAVAAGTAALGVVLAGVLAFRASFWGTYLATWTLWGAGGLWLALEIPGLCFGFVVPSVVAGAAAAVQVRLGREGCRRWATATALAPLFAAGVVQVPVIYMLPAAMGVGPGGPAGYALCLLLTSAVPLIARRELLLPLPALLAFGVGVLGLMAWCAAAPVHTPEQPRWLNVSYHLDHTQGAARWILVTSGEAPPPAYAEHGFAGPPTRLVPWSSRSGFVRGAPAHDLPAPVLADLVVEPTGGGGRRIRGTLRSSRGAVQAALLVPAAGLAQVKLGGIAPPVARFIGGSRILWCNSLPPGGLPVELTFRDAAPVEVLVLDATQGLPEDGAPLLAARGEAAVSSYQGDQTVVSARQRIE